MMDKEEARHWTHPCIVTEHDGCKVIRQRFFRGKRDFMLYTWDGICMLVSEPTHPNPHYWFYKKSDWQGCALELEELHDTFRNLILNYEGLMKGSFYPGGAYETF